MTKAAFWGSFSSNGAILFPDYSGGHTEALTHVKAILQKKKNYCQLKKKNHCISQGSLQKQKQQDCVCVCVCMFVTKNGSLDYGGWQDQSSNVSWKSGDQGESMVQVNYEDSLLKNFLLLREAGLFVLFRTSTS